MTQENYKLIAHKSGNGRILRQLTFNGELVDVITSEPYKTIIQYMDKINQQFMTDNPQINRLEFVIMGEEK